MDNIQWNTETQKFEYCGRNTKWLPNIEATFTQAARNHSAAICHRISFKTIVTGVLNCLNCFFNYLAADEDQRSKMGIDDMTCLYHLCGMVISVKNLEIDDSDIIENNLPLEAALMYASSDPRYKKILDAVECVTEYYDDWRDDDFEFSRPQSFADILDIVDSKDVEPFIRFLQAVCAADSFDYDYIYNFMHCLQSAGNPDANNECEDFCNKVSGCIKTLLDSAATGNIAQANQQNLAAGIQAIISECELEIKKCYTNQIHEIELQYQEANIINQWIWENHREPEMNDWTVFNGQSLLHSKNISSIGQVIQIYTSTSDLLKYILNHPYNLAGKLDTMYNIYSDPDYWKELVDIWNILNQELDIYYLPLDSGMSYLAQQANKLLDLLNSEPANLKLGNRKWNNSLRDSYDCETISHVSSREPLVLQLTSANDCRQLSNLMNLTIGQITSTLALSSSTEDGLYMYACTLGDEDAGFETVYTSNLPEQAFQSERSDIKNCQITYTDYLQDNQQKPLNTAIFPEDADTGNTEEDGDFPEGNLEIYT